MMTNVALASLEVLKSLNLIYDFILLFHDAWHNILYFCMNELKTHYGAVT